MNDTIAAARQTTRAGTLARHALFLVGLLALLSVVYWGAVYVVAGEPGMPLDDSYIHLQYARSTHQGRPFEYNPGEISNGTSAPLWTLMLPLTYVLTGDWLTASWLLGLLWTVGGVALVYWLVLRWTGRPAWALFAAVLVLLAHPTVVSAYQGMEVPAYVTTFLLGLLLYDFSRTAAPGRQVPWRLAASAAFAVGVWLRPEFLVIPVLIGLERAILLRRQGAAWFGRWLREMALHAAVWLVLLAPYVAFNQWVSGTWMPNTYTIKALARNSPGEVRWTSGLPAAWLHSDLPAVLRCFYLWMPMMLGTLVIGLLVNNAVLAWKLPQAIWRSRNGWLGPAGLLAALSLLGFPLSRALVDPLAVFQFQFQRYFGHITALMVILAVAGWACATAAPSRRLRACAVVAGLIGLVAAGWQPVVAVKNINEMQVRIGRWIHANTPPDAVVATNDVGAIAFYGHRRIIDTVGLTEPPLARHYLAGGTLEEYLRLKRPDYACLFANWHDGIARRGDLFEPVPELPRVRLPDNVICGGGTMYVLRTCWHKDFNPNWTAEAKARAERIARRAARTAAAADQAANAAARQ